MFDLLVGVVLLAVWGYLQYVVQPVSGWIHVALAAGVLALIRGIVRASPGAAVKR